MVDNPFDLSGEKADDFSTSKQIIFRTDIAGQNLLHHIAQYKEDQESLSKLNTLLFAINNLPPKEKKEFLNAKDRHNDTALDIAAKNGKWDMVMVLLEASAKGNFKNIMLEALKSNPAVDEKTKEKLFTAMLQSKNLGQSTPESTIKEFLKTKDSQGKSALDYLNDPENKDFCTYIISKNGTAKSVLDAYEREKEQKKQEEMSKAKENDVKHQEDALHVAAKNGNIGDVTILVNQGADLTKKDAAGKTPLQYAYDSKDQETISFLEKKIISSISPNNNINSKEAELIGLKKESVILHAMGHEKLTIDGVNPIQYAINEGIKIEGKDPLLFVLEQEKIKGKHPLSYLAENDIKIQDKDLVKLMTENKEYLNKAVESYTRNQQGTQAKSSQGLYKKFLQDMKIENKVSGYNFFKKLLNTISGGKLYKHTILAEEFKKLIGGRLESASSSENLTPSATPNKKGNGQEKGVGH